MTKAGISTRSLGRYGFDTTFSRRVALAGIAAASAAALPLPLETRRAEAQQATPRATSSPIAHKGVTYDVGTEFYPGYSSRPDSDRAFFPAELGAIRTELNCTSVGIYGSNPERLIEAASAAVEVGLNPWVQPRFIDEDADFTIPRLIALATELEALSTPSNLPVLNIGCEIPVFASGFVPGRNFDERFATVLETIDQIPEYNRRLNEFLARAVDALRPVFNGQITYSAGNWEEVDWTPFDVVGLNLYRDGENYANYADVLRSYQRFDLPIAITEFGCCSYVGADSPDSVGYAIIDFTVDPPEIPSEFVRDETVQANYILELLDIYEQEGVYAAFVHNFIEPESPHSEDPKYDLDMASYGIVRTFSEDSEQPYHESGYWEPKESFEAIAKRFASN